jgi:hypothetical protein
VFIKQHNNITIKADYDTPYKEIIDVYFMDFLECCCPDIHKKIDWSKNYEVLDNELKKISKNAKIGNRAVDKLIKIYLKDRNVNSDDNWVLAHIEVQSEGKTNFAERMFDYRCCLHKKYKKRVISLSLLIDQNKLWRPNNYRVELFGSYLEVRFIVVKIIDYKNNIIELKQSQNYFAVIILAQLMVYQNVEPEIKLRNKIDLTLHLYNKGWNKKDILNIYKFLDWIMVLPEEFELQYQIAIEQFEGENNMAYITTAERVGMRRGIEIGRQEGRQEGEQISCRKVAKKMMQEGLDIKTIIKVTGVKIEELK